MNLSRIRLRTLRTTRTISSPQPQASRFPTITSNMSSHIDHTTNFPQHTTSTPGEAFEVRQTHPTGDYKPDPSKSLPLNPARQALIDDILALYSCEPTIERVKRYTSDCVYDDQFVYANDRYKMAGQWFALPKLFKASKTRGTRSPRTTRISSSSRTSRAGPSS